MKTRMILKQDKRAIEADLHPYSRKVWLLNLFLDRMADAGYPVETPEQISELLSQGAEKYIRTRIVEGSNFELAGVKINRSALMSVVELPDLQEVQSVEGTLKQYHHIPISALDFEAGKFSVPLSLQEQIRDKHTLYANTPEQIAMYNAAKKVEKAINEFHHKYGQEKGRPLNYHPLGTPERYLNWNPQTWSWEVDVLTIMAQFK